MAEISDDYRGEKMGIACNDKPDGPLRCSFNMIRMEDGRICFYPDIRYPSLADQDKVLSGIKAAWEASPWNWNPSSNLGSILHLPGQSFCPETDRGSPRCAGTAGHRTAERQQRVLAAHRRLPNAIPYGATIPGHVGLCRICQGWRPPSRRVLRYPQPAFEHAGLCPRFDRA